MFLVNMKSMFCISSAAVAMKNKHTSFLINTLFVNSRIYILINIFYDIKNIKTTIPKPALPMHLMPYAAALVQVRKCLKKANVHYN